MRRTPWVASLLLVVGACASGTGSALTVAGPEATVAPSTSSSTSTPTTTTTTPGPTTTTASPTTTTTTLPVTLPPGPDSVMHASWRTIVGGDLAGPGHQDLWDVACNALRCVAAGLDGHTAIWTSPNAVDWYRLPAGTEWDDTQMLHIEPTPDGAFIGVGRRLGNPHRFASWASAEGNVWEPHDPPIGVLPTGVQQVHGFTAYPGGYIAVGSVNDAGDIDAAWWTSADGLNWTAGTIAEPGRQQMLGVAVADGVIVAAGENGSDTGVWRAPVGGAFTRIDDINLTIAVSDRDPAFAEARVFAWDIAATGPGFVAVGTDQTSPGLALAAVWTSADGLGWQRFGNETGFVPHMAEANFAGRGPWTVMDTVLDSNGTTIAIGRTGSSALPDIAIWESADGVTWKQGPVGARPEWQRVHRAVSFDGKLIAVGSTGPGDAGDGAVWVATAAPARAADPTAAWRRANLAPYWRGGRVSLAEFGDRLLTPIYFGQGTTMLSSSNGLAWEEVPADALQAEPFLWGTLVAGDGVLYYVGRDSGGAGVWRSADATTWVKAPAPTNVTGALGGAARVGATLYAAGAEDDGTPILWRSADGIAWSDASGFAGPGLVFRSLAVFGEVGVLVYEDPVNTVPAMWTVDAAGAIAPIPGHPAFSGSGFVPSSATVLGDRFVVVGTLLGGTEEPAIVHTADLMLWERVAIPASSRQSAYALGAAAASGSLVVVGLCSGTGGGSAVVWSSRDLEFWAETTVDRECASCWASAALPLGGRIVVGGTDTAADGSEQYAFWVGG